MQTVQTVYRRTPYIGVLRDKRRVPYFSIVKGGNPHVRISGIIDHIIEIYIFTNESKYMYTCFSLNVV